MFLPEDFGIREITPIFTPSNADTHQKMIETLSIFQWTILALTALCIGMSKTGVQGLMLLAVPYMAMAFGAKESTGVILPMLCMADIIAVVYYKRIADWKVVVKLLPTAIVGFFVALYVDKLIPANEFRQLMGWTLALVMVVMMWSELFAANKDVLLEQMNLFMEKFNTLKTMLEREDIDGMRAMMRHSTERRALFDKK